MNGSSWHIQNLEVELTRTRSIAWLWGLDGNASTSSTSAKSHRHGMRLGWRNLRISEAGDAAVFRSLAFWHFGRFLHDVHCDCRSESLRSSKLRDRNNKRTQPRRLVSVVSHSVWSVRTLLSIAALPQHQHVFWWGTRVPNWRKPPDRICDPHLAGLTLPVQMAVDPKWSTDLKKMNESLGHLQVIFLHPSESWWASNYVAYSGILKVETRIMLTIPGKLAHVSSTRPNFHHQCGLTNLVRLVRALWRVLKRVLNLHLHPSAGVAYDLPLLLLSYIQTISRLSFHT